MTEISILNSAFKLTRDIISNYPKRKEYQGIIEDIRRTRPFLADIINKHPLQFVGLLIVHHQRDQINQKSAFKINDDLSNKETQEIENIFLDFHHLNYRCLEPLLIKYPQLELSLFHYLSFEFPKPSIDQNRKINLIDNSVLNDFLKTFWEHPSFEIIQNNIGLLKNQSAEYIASAKRSIEKFIANGELKSSPAFREYSQLAETTKEKRLQKFIFGVICLSNTIVVLNELLFMAVCYDRLPKIDESNLLTYPRIYSDNIHNGLEIVCQINEKNINLIGPSWLFFMENKLNPGVNRSVLNLCIHKNISITQEYGEEITLNANTIDENLNPYANLLQA